MKPANGLIVEERFGVIRLIRWQSGDSLTMRSADARGMTEMNRLSGLTVLNAGGRDEPIDYSGGVSKPDGGCHPPVNYHAYAACTSGLFTNSIEEAIASEGVVLALLRKRIKKSFQAIQTLKAQGKRVFVSWKESGLHQVDAQLARRDTMQVFRQALALCDGVISSTEDLLPMYRSSLPEERANTVRFLPTPYPVDLPEWNFAQPLAERRGVLIGTREFKVPSRRHRSALEIALQLNRATGCEVTVINTEGSKGRHRIAGTGFADGALTIHEGRLPYEDYLRLMARHRFVLQCDHSSVPGQVAGDALLCRVPCIGGDGAIERIAFPSFCGHGRSSDELLRLAELLVRDDDACTAATEDSQTIASSHLSFKATARELRAFVLGES